MIKKQGTYEEYKKSPAAMMRLVIEGKVRIVGKDKYGRWIYREV